jgi:hypothetical protein|tara:strand:+ start:227 stop:481 length:255 start_codon:yes stop_codon:yes gene_type:complete
MLRTKWMRYNKYWPVNSNSIGISRFNKGTKTEVNRWFKDKRLNNEAHKKFLLEKEVLDSIIRTKESRRWQCKENIHLLREINFH